MPDPTPPKETSAAATGTNVATAIANNLMGNITEYTPDGSTQVNQTGTYVLKDPYTGEKYDIPTFTRTTTLSPEQQKIQDQLNAAKLNLGTLANDQSSFLSGYMKDPFKYDTNAHEQWAMGLYDKLNNPREQQQMQGLQSQLANSGVKLGSDAYSRAMGDQSKGIEDARNQFLLDSFQTGFGTAQAARNQPINEITALMSGGQVAQPNFTGLNFNRIPTTDNAGIIANYDQQRQAAAMANNQMLGGLFGGILSAGSAFLSDKRAKDDIKPKGKMQIEGDDGKTKTVGLFSYHYKGESKKVPRHIGVMAQEIKKKKPSAIVDRPDGLMAVDYSRL